MTSPLSTPNRALGRAGREPGARTSMLLARHARPPQRRWIVVGLGVLLVGNAVAAVIALVLFGGNSSSGTSPSGGARNSSGPLAQQRSSTPSTARTPAGVASAVRWMTKALPKNTEVLADSRVGQALRAAGFSAVQPIAGATSAPAGGVVVSTRQLRAAAASGPVADAVRSAIPLAVLGAGDSQVTVAQVSSTSADQLAAHRSADEAMRKDSEPELLANPAVTVAPAAASAVRDGALDLRVATVLAQMAANGKVELRAVVVDAAEQRAGLPARVVEVVATPADAQRRYLAGLTTPYRPLVQPLTGGALRLTWSLRPDPSDVSR